MSSDRTAISTLATLDRTHALHLLHQMLRIRRLEAKAAELYSSMKIRGFMHIAPGAADVRVHRRPVSTHQAIDCIARCRQPVAACRLGDQRPVRLG